MTSFSGRVISDIFADASGTHEIDTYREYDEEKCKVKGWFDVADISYGVLSVRWKDGDAFAALGID